MDESLFLILAPPQAYSPDGVSCGTMAEIGEPHLTQRNWAHALEPLLGFPMPGVGFGTQGNSLTREIAEQRAMMFSMSGKRRAAVGSTSYSQQSMLSIRGSRTRPGRLESLWLSTGTRVYVVNNEITLPEYSASIERVVFFHVAGGQH
jgi:hypothetical protein